MFRIADGREHFYQWDLDRQIIVEDNTIKEVHFCNRTDDCSLVVEVIGGLANVPNVILQKSFDIRVFGYDGKATRYDEAFKVKARTKPTDYVYTETEVKSYEYLDKRIDEIEKNGISEAVVEKAVKDYLTDVEVVDEKAREDIETIKNAGYATEEFVEDAVAGVEVDLTGYATENYVKNEIAKAQLSGGDGEDIDLSGYATKDELPTKVSQLENDSKFITREEVPETDLSEYITESELNAKGYLTQHQSLEDYAKKSEIPDTSKFITSIPSEYITESELDAKKYITSSNANALVNTLASSIEEELEQCAKKTDIPTVPTKVSAFENDKGYLTSIPGEYITEAELSAKNYLTEHQSLAAYATKTYVDNTVAENQPNLSKYALKTDIPSLNGYATESYVDTEMGKTRTWVNTKNFATEQYVDDAIDAIEFPEGADLSEYAKKSDIPSIEGLASEEYVDTAIAGIETSGSAEVYNLVLPTGDTAFTDSKSIEYLTRAWNGESVVALCEGRILTSVTVDVDDNAIRARAFFTDNLALHTYYAYTFRRDGENVWKLALKTSDTMRIPECEDIDLSDYYTKEEVNALIPDASKITFVNHSDTQETIEAILEAGHWPVFRGNEANNYRLPLIRKFSLTGVIYYEFGGVYDNLAYSIRYSSTRGWDTLVTSNSLVRSGIDLQANAIGDADYVLSKIKIGNSIYSIPEGGSADLSNYYTKDETYSKTEVDNKIASSGGGGGSEGSGVKIIQVPSSSSDIRNNPELVAELWQYLNEYYNNRNSNNVCVVPDSTIFYIQSLSMPNRWVTVGSINGTISTYGTYLMLAGFEPTDEKYTHLYTIYFNSDGTFQRLQTNYSTVVPESTGGGSDWTYTTDNYDSGLYNATEIYIMSWDGSRSAYGFSHVVLNPDSPLNVQTYNSFSFNMQSSDGNYSTWCYDGSSIQFNWAGDESYSYIMYK